MASQYRTFIGFVKYEPREGTTKRADGEPVEVRNIVVRQAGVKDQAIDVRATLWPSHDHVEIEQGDLVALEGKFSVNKGENSEGEPVTYFNLSVSGITKLGHADFGQRDDDGRSSGGDSADDGDEPW